MKLLKITAPGWGAGWESDLYYNMQFVYTFAVMATQSEDGKEVGWKIVVVFGEPGKPPREKEFGPWSDKEGADAAWSIVDANQSRLPASPPSKEKRWKVQNWLTVRTANCLLAAGIEYLEDAAALSDNQLHCIPNLGKKSTREIREVFKQRELGEEPRDWATREEERKREN